MTISDVGASTRLVLIAVVTMVLVGGCVSTSGTEPPSTEAERNLNELDCELALLRFDKLIEARSSEKDFSVAALIEAREIYQMGRQLYLQQEYELALQLIEEGIQLVE